jgi:hypothetical protein
MLDSFTALKAINSKTFIDLGQKVSLHNKNAGASWVNFT